MGAAYFSGLAVAWWLTARAWPRSLALGARAGALVALAFLVTALALDAPCPFCLTAQGAAFVFLWASERRRAGLRAARAELAFLVVGGAVLTTLVLCARAAERAGRSAAQAELARAQASPRDEERGFTGRHRLGPARAALRLVLFVDYRCADCRRLDQEALALLRTRADLSLSIKHFPLDDDCNRRARALGRDPHPSACFAARAAEAAALAGGDETFWRMHAWLFEHDETELAPQALERALVSLGLAPGPFQEFLLGVEAGARVTADVEEGLALGLEGTPAVFLNGVELRAWRAPGALARAVAELAAAAPVVRGPEADVPPTALERALEDWRREPRRELPTRPGLPPAGALELVLWGDYLDESTRALLARLRPALATRPEARLVVRHYPLDPACVPDAPALHPGACQLARLAEAARALGGEVALDRLEAWLLTQTGRGLLDVVAAARAAGVAPDELSESALSPSTLAAVTLDVDAARKLGIRTIPLLFIDGKLVPRWRLDGEGDVLAALLAEAGR